MKSPQQKWIKLGVLLVGVAAVGAVLYVSEVNWSDLNPQRVRTYVASFGWWAPVIYGLVYAQPLVPLPSTVMMIAAGLSFGIAGGMAVALMAAILRGCGQFAIARVLGRDAVTSLLRGRAANLDEWIGKNGFQTVFLCRVAVPIPFDIMNFSLGFSRIRFGPFVLATSLGLLPACLVWVYVGHTMTDATSVWKIAGALLGLLALWCVHYWVRARRVARLPREDAAVPVREPGTPVPLVEITQPNP